ncbi:hypothetical protein [Janibacter melonis]|uniref:hypothetical protein n=1 Tax=Janibacter melonis TaxID=262209 RepID=UPI002094E2B8|nr:hypothetical protein [Janibacter melonis]
MEEDLLPGAPSTARAASRWSVMPGPLAESHASPMLSRCSSRHPAVPGWPGRPAR